MNVAGIRAKHPSLNRAIGAVVRLLLNEGTLPPRDREIVLLRIGWNCASIYEFAQHRLIARACDVADEEIDALTRPLADFDWSAHDRSLAAAADELCQDFCVTNETWSVLSSAYSDEQLIELVFAAGVYQAMCCFLNSTGVQLEEGVEGWPSGVEPG